MCDITYALIQSLALIICVIICPQILKCCSAAFSVLCVDEVDSILIDEARTPLIISGQVDRPQEKYLKAAQLASSLFRAEDVSKDGIDPVGDYEVDEKQRSCILTDEGFRKAESILGVSDLYDPKDPWAHYITNALKAKELFIKDVNYIVRNDEAVIVDEFTGRIMSGRRWSDGQHQAIEARRGYPFSQKRRHWPQLHTKTSCCIQDLRV